MGTEYLKKNRTELGKKAPTKVTAEKNKHVLSFLC